MKISRWEKIRLHVIFLPVIILIFIIASPSFAQFNTWHIDNSFSTEWEATAFNGGRRMARDSDGYLHTVYHSRPTSDTGAGPTGTGCSIFYTYSLQPCKSDTNPSQVEWAVPVEIVPVDMYPYDNRYPSIVIEHGSPQDPKGNDVLHVVWQRDSEGMVPGSGDYSIWYINTAGQDIDIGGAAFPVWGPPVMIWNTVSHHDLVPTIACNYNNHLHVAWQAEGWEEPGPANSEILYSRSVDQGVTWTDNLGVALTSFGGLANPYNLSQTPCSSQCPSIACITDAPTTPTITPGYMEYTPGTVSSYEYTTTTVHVAWHDKTDMDTGACTSSIGDYHIWYAYSQNDGQFWPVMEDVTLHTSGDRDIYPSLTVDYYDQPHIAFMHNCDNEHDPDPPGAVAYLAGVDPYNPASFPGPDPRMYGNNNPNSIVPQIIMYTYRSWTPPLPMGVWNGRTSITAGTTDDEFPSIAMDRQMGIHLAWQSWGSITGEYVIMICFNSFNWSVPGFNSWMGWSMIYETTFDMIADDLFPSEAHKKLGMYSGGTLGDFDLAWTRVNGLGQPFAIDPIAQQIWYMGATTWHDPPAYPMAPLNPQVEGKTNPTDVSIPSPNMTWTFNDLDLPGDTQTAYRVLLASSSAILANNIGDIWDTGKVSSGTSSHPLSPPPPGGSATYYWKVMTWDSANLPGPFCGEQTFKYSAGVPVELSVFSIE